ncbi:unnamed protein product [Cochlearia groenlandica]
MTKTTNQEKWQAQVSTTLTKAKADQIWPLFTDFFNFNKYFPSLATCHGVHGIKGEPGCIRFCSGSSIKSNGQDSSVVGWSKEKLVAVDDVERVMRYEIVESNIGFESYVSTVKITPRGEGCLIEWGFTVDPVRGLCVDELVEKYEKALEIIANNMEESLMKTTT